MDECKPLVSGSHAWSFDTMLLRILFLVGSARYCSPRHRMSFDSRDEGSKLVG